MLASSLLSVRNAFAKARPVGARHDKQVQNFPSINMLTAQMNDGKCSMHFRQL